VVIRRLITLGVIAALLVGADVAARGFVSSTVSSRAQQEAPSGSTASASVGGFPFLPPLLTGGRVDTASVHVENLTAQALVFASVDVSLTGVHLDRARLFKDRKARITKIDHGTVRAVVTADALSNALHVPVKMAGGQITVTVAGTDIVVTPHVVHDQLTLTGALGRSFALAIPSSGYMPCVSDVSVADGEMELSCTIHDVPPALLDAVQRD
jgi:hypothetical protein